MTAQRWEMSGDWFDLCNCDVVPCPCNFSLEATPTEGYCNTVLALHIDRGFYGDVPLDDLSFAIALSTPGRMALGNATEALYIDERADEQQRRALLAICRGEAGGPPRMMADAVTVTNFLGVKYVPITFKKEGRRRSGVIPGILDFNLEGLTGADPNREVWMENIRHPMNTRLALARGATSTFRDYGLSWDHSGKQALYSTFHWSGP